jgi:hypothetical protein
MSAIPSSAQSEFSPGRKIIVRPSRGRRALRALARYLFAICVGVVGTLAWQSYGEATKQIIATRAPELGWSPEAKQMIASLVQQLGWTKPPAGPENTAVQLSAPKTAQTATAAQAGPETAASTSKALVASLDQQQVQQIEGDIAAARQTVEQYLAAVRQTIEQLAVGQDEVLREIAKLQAPAAPARNPMQVPPLRAPTPPH